MEITKDTLTTAQRIFDEMGKNSRGTNPGGTPDKSALENQVKELLNLCADDSTRNTLQTWLELPITDNLIIPCLLKVEAVNASCGNTFDNAKIDYENRIFALGFDNAAADPEPAAPSGTGTGAATSGTGSPITIDNLVKQLELIRPELHKDQYPLIDIGYSRLFTEIYKDICKYNSTAKCWYFYNGKCWIKDPDGKQVEALAKTFYDGLCRYCVSGVIDPTLQPDFMKEISKLGKYNPRITVIKDAASNRFFSYEDLDRDGNLFNCQNGVFNLQTMTFTPGHDPALMLSKISNVIYDPAANSTEWEKYINEVMQGDKEKIRYIQKVLGYCLTTDTTEECLWFFYGEKSRNGKTTGLETIAYMMGGQNGYAAAVDPETLAEKKYKNSSAPNGDIACLEGCRFLNVSEPPKGMLFNASLVKKMTGGNMIKARDLQEKFHEYKPLYKIIIDTNYLPVIADDTLFLSNRVIVIPFERYFPESEQDHTLKKRLRKPENISGLFNWCLRGLENYRKEGLIKPDSIRNATELYQSNSDKVNLFFDECMEKLPGINTTAKALYQEYKRWCYDCAYTPEGQQNFFGILRKKGLLSPTGTVGGKTCKNVILNYGIKTP